MSVGLGIRKRIEFWFEAFGHLVYKYRLVSLILMLILLAGLGTQLPKLTFDTSTEGFYHEEDPALLTYNEFRRQFGRDDLIIVAIEPTDVFDQNFFKKLKAFHKDLEKEVPYIDDIISMVNVRNTRGEGDRLIVEDLLEKWPEDEAALTALRQRVMSNPLYLNRVISEDGRFTAVAIKMNSYTSLGIKEDALQFFDDAEPTAPVGGQADVSIEEPTFLTDKEKREAVEAVQKVLNRYQAPDFKLFLAGSPVVEQVTLQLMMKDQSRFVALVILTIGLCLFVMFRRISSVLLPLFVVASALVSTLSLMAIFRVPIKHATMTLPSLLLAVGVTYSIHILSLFYQQFKKTRDREEAICQSLGHSVLAIVMTSLTTAAGLASFATSQLVHIADLGIFASIGVMLAMVYTIILMPTFLAITPMRIKSRAGVPSGRTLMDRLLDATADFATSYPKGIIAVCLILFALSILGASKLTFSHNVLTWLPKNIPVRQATEKIDHELKGTVALEVIVDTKQENGLYDVEILNKLGDLARKIEEINEGDLFVGKATSVTDILKEINKALNENRPEFYVIPQDPKLIPQEFLLFENSGSDDLEDVVDSQFSKARFTIKVPWLDALWYVPFIDNIESLFQQALGYKATITVTGMMALLGRSVHASIHSAAASYVIAGIVITLMMIVMIGSIGLGLISMIPSLLAILLVMGIMILFDFPFDMFTMLIGSIAVGLAVDNMIHLMHNFRRYYGETNNTRLAFRETFHTAGRALVVATVVLSIGFFIYMFASMNNLFHFGLLTGITIILALVANFILAPAFVTLITRPAPPAEKEVHHNENYK
jgi:hydrophobe/amphiphile efflux-3 (HAE3) family protein